MIAAVGVFAVVIALWLMVLDCPPHDDEQRDKLWDMKNGDRR